LLLVFMFTLMTAMPAAAEETNTSFDREELISKIKALILQLQELRGEIEAVQTEIKSTLSDSLEEGMTHEDIRKIQKLLATDPDIYPEGITTGYYGRLTREALKRFQMKHNLEVTGEIDEETRELLEEYLSEKFGDNIPAGLLRAPGIQKKVELRMKEGCESRKAKGTLCTKIKLKYDNEDADEDKKDEDEDEDDEDTDDEDDN
jgi:hypothetical protein